ncbi:MAG: L-threonylcarbamoyladenylate synthase [Chloroflexi bacterium]|jgi:L-threonylcarbamoyladenylate synthase|nr:MAG: L-threonylcarbamoyladenylate synthase [Chloroflexota bacterium]
MNIQQAIQGLSPRIRIQVELGVEILGKGGLLAYPTDTVYGLGADFSNEMAVKNVVKIKNRKETMGFPLLLSKSDMLPLVAENISPVAWPLIENFWPGPLTLILPKTGAVPDVVSGGRATVAVRVPDHAVPRVLSEWLGRPIVGTSANITGFPSLESSNQVTSQIGDLVDLVIEGSSLGRLESTIIDLTDIRPKIVRRGAVPVEEIRLFCPLLPC